MKAASTGAKAPATAVEPAAVEQRQLVVKRQGVFEVTACSRAPRGTLLLFDFDRTLTDYDAGECAGWVSTGPCALLPITRGSLVLLGAV